MSTLPISGVCSLEINRIIQASESIRLVIWRIPLPLVLPSFVPFSLRQQQTHHLHKRFLDFISAQSNLSRSSQEPTVRDVLPYAIQRLQSAGYRLVTVAECVGRPAYQSFTTPGTPDASWGVLKSILMHNRPLFLVYIRIL